MRDDEWLLAELREAVTAAREVPTEFVAAGKAAFTWRTVDFELAALAEDSATGAGITGVRADTSAARALRFTASGISIELELTAGALLGQLVPPQGGEVELQTQDGSRRTADVDDVGWFSFRPAPSGMFRLRLQVEDGTAVLTEWVNS